jgi:hypothetical protein
MNEESRDFRGQSGCRSKKIFGFVLLISYSTANIREDDVLLHKRSEHPRIGEKSGRIIIERRSWTATLQPDTSESLGINNLTSAPSCIPS